MFFFLTNNIWNLCFMFVPKMYEHFTKKALSENFTEEGKSKKLSQTTEND